MQTTIEVNVTKEAEMLFRQIVDRDPLLKAWSADSERAEFEPELEKTLKLIRSGSPDTQITLGDITSLNYRTEKFTPASIIDINRILSVAVEQGDNAEECLKKDIKLFSDAVAELETQNAHIPMKNWAAIWTNVADLAEELKPLGIRVSTLLNSVREQILMPFAREEFRGVSSKFQEPEFKNVIRTAAKYSSEMTSETFDSCLTNILNPYRKDHYGSLLKLADSAKKLAIQMIGKSASSEDLFSVQITGAKALFQRFGFVKFYYKVVADEQFIKAIKNISAVLRRQGVDVVAFYRDVFGEILSETGPTTPKLLVQIITDPRLLEILNEYCKAAKNYKIDPTKLIVGAFPKVLSEIESSKCAGSRADKFFDRETNTRILKALVRTCEDQEKIKEHVEFLFSDWPAYSNSRMRTELVLAVENRAALIDKIGLHNLKIYCDFIEIPMAERLPANVVNSLESDVAFHKAISNIFEHAGETKAKQTITHLTQRLRLIPDNFFPALQGLSYLYESQGSISDSTLALYYKLIDRIATEATRTKRNASEDYSQIFTSASVLNAVYMLSESSDKYDSVGDRFIANAFEIGFTKKALTTQNVTALLGNLNYAFSNLTPGVDNLNDFKNSPSFVNFLRSGFDSD